MKNLLEIKILGVNIDSTMEKIYRKNIPLSKLKRQSHDEIQFTILKSDYKKIEHLLKNFKIEIKEHGLKTLKRFLISNLAIILALPLSLFFMMKSNDYIWDIKIEGLNEIDISVVETILDDLDIKRGKKSNIDLVTLKTTLLNSGKFAQASCILRGNTLIINLSEKLVYVPEDYPPIVAQYDCIIEDFTLFRGTLNIKVGDFVRRGEVLVYPYIIDKNGGRVPVMPSAEIKTKSYISHTEILREEETILIRSGKTKIISNYYFKNKKISQNDDIPFVFYETKVYNKYVSSIIPIKKVSVEYIELVESVRHNDLIGSRPDLEEKSRTLAKKDINEDDIIETRTDTTICDGMMFSTATVSFHYILH